MAITEVGDAIDTLDFVVAQQRIDFFDDLLGPNEIRQFGDDDALAFWCELLDVGTGPKRDGPASGGVHVGQTVVDDDATRREIRALHMLHELFDGWFGATFGEHKLNGVRYLGQIVWRHRRGHTHGNTTSAIHQQIRQQTRKALRLGGVAVVGRRELDGFFVEFTQHGHCGRGESTFGVPVCGRRLVKAAEVSLRVDQGDIAGKILPHTDQGVVDSAVAVGVELTDRVADDSGAFTMWSFGADSHVQHGVQDAALHWF